MGNWSSHIDERSCHFVSSGGWVGSRLFSLVDLQSGGDDGFFSSVTDWRLTAVVATMDLPEMSAEERSFLEDLPHSVGSDSAIPASLLDGSGLSVDDYADGRRVVTDCLFPGDDNDGGIADHATVLSRFDASLNPSRPKFIWEKGWFHEHDLWQETEGSSSGVWGSFWSEEASASFLQ